MRISIEGVVPRTFFQSLLIPAKIITILFLRILGFLLDFFGARNCSDYLRQKAHFLDCESGALLTGIFAYGHRFLVKSINHLETCRGACYWLIERHLKFPSLSLVELAKALEDGPSEEVIQMHREYRGDLIETKIWSKTTAGVWPSMPELQRGAYTFLIGYSRDETHHEKGHLIAFFNREEPMLFDPDIGLFKWEEGDWEPLLQRIGRELRSTEGGYFTIECYSYDVRR